MTVRGERHVRRYMYVLSSNDWFAFTNHMHSYCVVFRAHMSLSTQVQHQVAHHLVDYLL